MPRPPLGRTRRQTYSVLLPHILGLALDDPHLAVAVGRFDDFLRVVPGKETAASVHQMLDAVAAFSFALYARPPGALTPEQVEDFYAKLFFPEANWPNNLLEVLRRLFGDNVPSVRDLSRTLRELCCVAYYGNPRTNKDTGFRPLWRNKAVLAVAPSEARARPFTRKHRTRLDLEAIEAALARGGDTPDDQLFAHDGRPKVAIIGSGCGGAVAASRLAADFDVAVFEAGPALRPDEFATDNLAAMALIFGRGLMYPTKDLDLRLLQARMVGGGSALNEGVSVRPRKTTLDHWQRIGTGLDREKLEAALEIVEQRQRFMPYADDVLTTPSLRFERGAQESPQLMVQRLRTDIATHAAQHEGQRWGRDGVRGESCLACGYCNFGCRFGHHLSVDRTFLKDALAAGAKLHPNTPVERLVLKQAGHGRWSVRGLKLERKPRGRPIEVDHVVLAGGAIGSPALLQRTLRAQPGVRALPTVKAGHVGGNLGFNVGTSIWARWADAMPRPGWKGQQVGFIATKPGDETFILENGFAPPAVLSPIMPGVGKAHRHWMTNYPHTGMLVNTLGTPSDGRVDHRGRVSFKVGDGTMDIVHRSLAMMVDAYLHSGAEEVAISGLLAGDGTDETFGPRWRGQEAKIRRRVEQLAPSAEHLAMGSGHSQGGLIMNRDPERGAVGEDYRVHGLDNAFVADISLFPTTITVNPQWLVMALGYTAAGRIGEEISRAARSGA